MSGVFLSKNNWKTSWCLLSPCPCVAYDHHANNTEEDDYAGDGDQPSPWPVGEHTAVISGHLGHFGDNWWAYILHVSHLGLGERISYSILGNWIHEGTKNTQQIDISDSE